MSTPISQKQAVVSAVSDVMGSSFTSGSTLVKENITSEQLADVRHSVFTGILNGDISFNKDISDHKALGRYVNGMIDNHFRKAKELNGGNKYLPTNPGRGSRDPQLSALRKLIKSYGDGSPEFEKISTAISTRQEELTVERKAAADMRKKQSIVESIDTSVLPDELSSLVAGE